MILFLWLWEIHGIWHNVVCCVENCWWHCVICVVFQWCTNDCLHISDAFSVQHRRTETNISERSTIQNACLFAAFCYRQESATWQSRAILSQEMKVNKSTLITENCKSHHSVSFAPLDQPTSFTSQPHPSLWPEAFSLPKDHPFSHNFRTGRWAWLTHLACHSDWRPHEMATE